MGVAGVGIGSSGSDGKSGSDGQHGTAALPNTVSLMSVPNQPVFLVTTKMNDVEDAVLPLYDGSVCIHLLAKGGEGGKGGDGGQGTDSAVLSVCYVVCVCTLV